MYRRHPWDDPELPSTVRRDPPTIKPSRVVRSHNASLYDLSPSPSPENDWKGTPTPEREISTTPPPADPPHQLQSALPMEVDASTTTTRSVSPSPPRSGGFRGGPFSPTKREKPPLRHPKPARLSAGAPRPRQPLPVDSPDARSSRLEEDQNEFEEKIATLRRELVEIRDTWTSGMINKELEAYRRARRNASSKLSREEQNYERFLKKNKLSASTAYSEAKNEFKKGSSKLQKSRRTMATTMAANRAEEKP
ncbi:hypothetical protein JCM3766R1_003756 [Sporobolomyces carnicolor]